MPDLENHLNFRSVLRTLRKVDPDLSNQVGATLSPDNWRRLLSKLNQEQPVVFEHYSKLLKAAQQGEQVLPDQPSVNVLEAVKNLAVDLKDAYSCQEGFLPADQTKARAVVVRLKHPKVITGLPKEIMRQSSKLAKDHGGQRKWTMGFDNRSFVTDLEPDAIEALKNNPMVESVEDEGEAHILVNERPIYNPSGINTDWGVARVPGAVAWGRGLFGQNVKLCVIDTGIMKGHQAFWKDGVTPFKGGYNFVANKADPEDDEDHGTYCCSIICGQHNGILGSYKGIAPNIDLYVVKSLDSKGSGTLANIAAGIDWARTNGMDIISMSLGGSSGTATLQAACDAAWYAGCLVVAAAGNEGPGDNTVGFPGAYNSAVAVAAVNYDEYVADFSSRGPQVELAGPGVSITGALSGYTYKSYAVPGSGELYMTASGTSAACPHVAAAAALIKSWYPLATNLELRTLLRDHLRDI